jgi:hypothetical protein
MLQSVDTTVDGQTGTLPDDNLIAEPLLTLTMTPVVTEQFPPCDVRPSMAQIGGRYRAGWYSCDSGDNRTSAAPANRPATIETSRQPREGGLTPDGHDLMKNS